MQIPDKTNICAAIITYHPDSELSSRVCVIARQVDKILLVDNGSNEHESDILAETISQTGADIIHNTSNVGIAAALNQAVEWAREHGYAWLLTMDQDTLLAESAVSAYALALESVNDAKVAVMGANFNDKLTGLPLMPEDSFCGSAAMDVKTVITSGSLMSMEAVDAIGRFREDFFIDYVDDEYCLRALRMGFRVMLTREPLIEHAIGSPRWHSILGRKLISPHMSIERQYYISRNYVAMIKEFWRYERQWLVGMTKTRIKQIILLIMFEDHRAVKLWYAFKGLIDGLLGRMEPLNTSPSA
ncbi:MAG: glycosyltransferase [Armatimonadota bacterium]